MASLSSSKQSVLSAFFNVPKRKTEEPSTSKKEYEKKRKRSFLPSWKDLFPGLEDGENGMVCSSCKRFPTKAGNTVFLTGCKSYRIESIKAHFSTTRHIMCREAELVAKKKASGDVEPGPMDAVLHKLKDEEAELLKKCFNTAYFVMHYEMPWTSYPNLLNLQIKNGSNLQLMRSYHTDKACARFGEYIAESIREPIREALRNAKNISIMFDGATDSSVSEVEIVYCRLVENGQLKEFFIGLEDLKHAHSQGVFDAIDAAMTKFGCPDWLDKVVGAGSDGASVNVGRNNSVKTKLLQEHPYIVVTHCLAHRLELGVLSAIKDNDMLKTVHDMLYQIHKHYHYSPKALRELKAVAEVMEEHIIKPQRLQGTRWLPHIMKASKALMDGYTVLRSHFEHVSQAGPNAATPAVKGRAIFLVDKLKDFRVLKFMFFLEDLLDIVSALSLKLQSSCLTCMAFLDALETANLMLIQLQQEPGNCYRRFISDLVNTGNPNEWTYKGQAITYYNEQVRYDFNAIINVVLDRINARMNDDIIKKARVLDCKDWPRNRVDLADYGIEEIDQLTRHFNTVLVRQGCDVASIPNEWTQVKAHLGGRMLHNPGARALPSISDIFEGDHQFPNIIHLVEIILVLPLSTAVCERGFSAVKRIKTDWRSSLTTANMNDLLCVSIEGPTLEEYDAQRAVHLWWTQGQRARRPEFIAEGDVGFNDVMQGLF